ncbi:S9 family peptidase [Terriglobus albidus]|uniref:S9 family peptidase n=1 Tax=Terriglobus albidus TaxID=1592106 RepID=UPI0021E09381|nr:S9 family peptidase [Terriglobus albidus]
MRYVAFAVLAFICAQTSFSAVTPEDYERAAKLNEKYGDWTENVVRGAHWVQGEHVLLYDKTVAGGGHQFFLADVETGKKELAFDHQRLAAALGAATHEEVKPAQLPLRDARLEDHRSSLAFRIGYTPWRCNLKNYACKGDEDGADGSRESSRNNESRTVASPDRKWEALVVNSNLVVRSVDGKQRLVLSTDGSEGNYYDLDTVSWSPDSSKLVIYRVRPGYHRTIRFVQSSPATQLQPLYPEIPYAKPGDVLDLPQPVLFDVAAKKEIAIANDLFPNPYELSGARWWQDCRGFTFEYNQRGHQVYRVIEVDGATGAARTLVNETSDTFVDYRPLIPEPQDTGKVYRRDFADGKEILWASERDGWEHLYLLDGRTGSVKNRITRGEWVVRSVDRVDEEKRMIWFSAGGMNAGEDPYFVHAYRIGFDGTGLTSLTPSAGNHKVAYSEDGTLYFDLVSTVEDPPVLTIHRTSDCSLVLELERGRLDKLKAAGWHAPEPFHALGRDGKTEIWGVVWKPANFDPKKRYPVVENIYAGPQGSFVPKTFSTRAEPLTELGFVVVQIDGMGTNNRSKAFHNVAWKNLKDAGFEDRILWHRTYASGHPWYDITRMGIFGTSAGGQSAMGALLFHPEFYKAAVANSGCHDNRMDKIWWNEQWMGWPIGPEYAASSNVDNAWRLKGKLMLVVGEMDDNVDPASTFQVADRLEKANKIFDLLYVPGGKHGSGGTYGQRKLEDFFVQALYGDRTPDWNALDRPAKP